MTIPKTNHYGTARHSYLKKLFDNSENQQPTFIPWAAPNTNNPKKISEIIDEQSFHNIDPLVLQNWTLLGNSSFLVLEFALVQPHQDPGLQIQPRNPS
jgi:hypothetical protein